jgi:hypothetical protein
MHAEQIPNASSILEHSPGKRVMVVFTGPPIEKEDDERVVQTLMASPGKRVVCGGTTANIVARQLGRRIDVDLETATDTVPAAGRIEGIDLVTEGTLTVTKALDILRSNVPQEELKLRVDGASRLAVALREADEVQMLVGRAMNPAHQDPNLPRDLGIKAQMIRTLAEVLQGEGKEVRIRYF